SSDVSTPKAGSAAKLAVDRPAAATEPRIRLLSFINDLQSQSFLVPVTQRFVETRPHFLWCSVLPSRCDRQTIPCMDSHWSLYAWLVPRQSDNPGFATSAAWLGKCCCR